jgi:glycosyltransferase involved in cell wall biosynthesis
MFYDNLYGFHSSYSRDWRRQIGLPLDDKPRVMGYIGVEDYGDKETLPISIVISAYGAEEYIKQCLDSIEDQTYFMDNDNYEVLIGVDGCSRTLAKVKGIRNQYRNVRVFMNESNSGVYATINALIDKAKNDIILRFDADDVMKPHMIKRGMYYAKNYDIVMFGYDVFYNDVNKINIQKFRCADGVIFLRKDVFERAGGFRPWPMAADSEFIARVRNNCKVKRTRARLFHRRLHDDSLTRDISTGYKSKQRRELAEKIRIYKEGEDIKIETVKAKQNEI